MIKCRMVKVIINYEMEFENPFTNLFRLEMITLKQNLYLQPLKEL